MQTFLPYPDFERSARVLDQRRLGKQRVECIQVVRGLSRPGYGWRNHPAFLMWKGFEEALGCYAFTCCEVWTERGFADTCAATVATDLATIGVSRVRTQDERAAASELPPWLGDEAFHLSHRSSLLRKDPGHYGPLFPDVPADLDYVWPVRRQARSAGLRQPPPNLAPRRGARPGEGRPAPPGADLGLAGPAATVLEVIATARAVRRRADRRRADRRPRLLPGTPPRYGRDRVDPGARPRRVGPGRRHRSRGERPGAPSDPRLLGWWRDGAEPGALRGTTVITGHSVSTGGGALDELHTLERGSDVVVRTDQGQVAYEVTDVARYAKTTLASVAERVFAQDVPGRLVLVTCIGYDGAEYLANTVVVAAPVE